MNKKMLGAIVAMAAAGVLAANSGLADDKKAEKKADKKATVKCMGNNSCKGTGACGSADGSNACAGKNACKGKGWTMVGSEADCTKGGGKVVKEEKKAEEPKKS